MDAPPRDDRRQVRRLRLALVGTALLAALCILAVAGVLVYWHLYLLEPAAGRAAPAPAPAFVLSAGDNSYLGGVSALLDRNIFKPLATLMANAPLWASLGEHDLFGTNGRPVIHALDSPGDGHRYTVEYGPIQI